MDKPTRAEQMILARVSATLQSGKKVTVDGVSVQGIRFKGFEIEVNWCAETEAGEELAWSVVQPNYLHELDNGELELETH